MSTIAAVEIADSRPDAPQACLTSHHLRRRHVASRPRTASRASLAKGPVGLIGLALLVSDNGAERARSSQPAHRDPQPV